MPTHEARMNRIVGSRAALVFLAFTLVIMGETYWNAVHHGASEADRFYIKNDLEYTRSLVLEQRKEADALKAAMVLLQSEVDKLHDKIDRLREKLDGVPPK